MLLFSSFFFLPLPTRRHTYSDQAAAERVLPGAVRLAGSPDQCPSGGRGARAALWREGRL